MKVNVLQPEKFWQACLELTHEKESQPIEGKTKKALFIAYDWMMSRIPLEDMDLDSVTLDEIELAAEFIWRLPNEDYYEDEKSLEEKEANVLMNFIILDWAFFNVLECYKQRKSREENRVIDFI